MSNLVKLQEEVADLLSMLNNRYIEVRSTRPDPYNVTQSQFAVTLKRIVALCEAVKEDKLDGQ